jgi:hypothetical protein
MKTRKNSNRPSEKGQSLVELALSLTFILILLAGTVYFGIGLFYYIAMRDAVQEGAVYASMNPPASSGSCPGTGDPAFEELCDRVKTTSGGSGLVQVLYDSVSTDVDVTLSGAACEGNTVTVDFTHEYSLAWLPIGSFIEPFIGSNSIMLRATVTNVILSPPCP